jgi:hypothetical protein
MHKECLQECNNPSVGSRAWMSRPDTTRRLPSLFRRLDLFPLTHAAQRHTMPPLRTRRYPPSVDPILAHDYDQDRAALTDGWARGLLSRHDIRFGAEVLQFDVAVAETCASRLALPWARPLAVKRSPTCSRTWRVGQARRSLCAHNEGTCGHSILLHFACRKLAGRGVGDITDKQISILS